MKKDCLLDIFPETYRNWVVEKARESLIKEPVSITEEVAEHSLGSKHDYYSNGDYWWPNTETDDGLPYVKRDGESNPDNFNAHRFLLRSMRTNVAQLAAGYKMTGDEKMAKKAVQFLTKFFLNEQTKMNPHLKYAQAIPGVCTGRGIGVIDTLHLIDVPQAIEVLRKSKYLTVEIYQGLKKWFQDYLTWMSVHPNGIEERQTKNNHSVCWFVQAATFANFIEDVKMIEFCRQQYKTNLIPNQMEQDGSFPRELDRTKPYNYSIFVVDNMVTLTYLLSIPTDNLWRFKLDDGRGIQKALSFIFPYLEDKWKWPYRKDIEHFKSWPARMSFLLFSGIFFDDLRYIDLWNRMEIEPNNNEVRRNIAIRQPIIWL